MRYCEFKALACGKSLTYRPKSNYQTCLPAKYCNVEFVLQLRFGLATQRRNLGTCDELLRSIFMLKHNSKKRMLNHENILLEPLRALLCGRDCRAAESQHAAQRPQTQTARLFARQAVEKRCAGSISFVEKLNFQPLSCPGLM